jgi:hypothetical protein
LTLRAEGKKAIWIEKKSFIEHILETTAFKSKILLTENNLLTLSNIHPELEDFEDFIKHGPESVKWDRLGQVFATRLWRFSLMRQPQR